MAQNVEILRNAEAGKDIYVVGSGKSIDYLPDSFWEGKIVIGVNTVPNRVPCQYLVSHHYKILQPFIDRGKVKVITSEVEACIFHCTFAGWTRPTYWYEKLSGDFYVYEHLNQGYVHINLSVFDRPHTLITGGSIVTTALHFAYFLGAKNIVCVGVDGGSLDGEMNYKDYENPTPALHMSNVSHQLEKMANAIRERGIPVMSINPFLNFCNEGHEFKAMPDLMKRPEIVKK
jgi:hypothetical protein